MRNLKFVIDGSEYKTYDISCNFKTIKEDFIQTPLLNDSDKHMGIILGDNECNVTWLLSITKNTTTFYNKALIGKCYYPLNIRKLNNIISDIILHYAKQNYNLEYR